MDLNELREILDARLPDETTEMLVIRSLAKDKQVIPTIIRLIGEERESKREMYEKMNLLLSKADIGLDDSKYNRDGFMQKEIRDFYIEYKGIVGHCFKNLFK